ALVSLAGCPQIPLKPARGPTVSRVEAASESTVVNALAVVPPYLLVGTSAGLERWDLRSGTLVAVDAERGWPGGGVRAIAARTGESAAWVATSAGLLRVDVGDARVV